MDLFRAIELIPVTLCHYCNALILSEKKIDISFSEQKRFKGYRCEYDK